MTEPESFGALLRRHRRAAGLSQEQLAERANMSSDAVSALERGTRQSPYRETVAALADALHLGPEDRAALDDTVDRTTRRGRTATPSINLPHSATPLIGRDREIEEAVELVVSSECRLLTLAGPGGVGKTRLAYRVARDAIAHFADGGALVELASLRDASLVAPAIAHAFGAVEGIDDVHGLAALLGERAALLVLDNFEHLLPAAVFVADLLASCPRLHIIVTSRATLRVRGERVYPVSPLQTPHSDAAPSLEELVEISACALLLQRAQGAVPGFEATPANAPALSAICRQLDGLPLALELAAARLTVLSPQLLLERLEHRLPLLTGGDRDLPERQRTLYATIAWSYALLAPGEQRLFRQVSTLIGGGTVQSIEILVAGDAGTEAVVDRLAALVEKSLLQRTTEDDEPRFTMLETIREFALEHLSREGETDATLSAHARYFSSLASRAESELTRPQQAYWLQRLDREHGNIRQALEVLRSSGDLDGALRLAHSLWRFWSSRSYVTEGRSQLRKLLAEASFGNVGALVRAQALFAAGALAYSQVDYTAALEHWNEALRLYRQEGDELGVATTLNGTGVAMSELGLYAEARSYLSESIALYQKLGNAERAAVPLSNLANVVRYQGDYATAATLYEQALATDRATGSGQLQASTLDNLAQIALETGDYERAESLGNESLDLLRTLGDSSGMAHTLVTLGCNALDRGSVAVARVRFEEALALFQEVGSEGLEVYALQNLGTIALRTSDGERARELSDRALRLSRTHGDRRGEAYSLLNLGELAQLEGQLETASNFFIAALEINESLGFSLGIAESCERRAHLALIEGSIDAAVDLYARASDLRRRMGAPVPLIDRARMDEDMAQLRHLAENGVD